jgi:hypothetical protein
MSQIPMNKADKKRMDIIHRLPCVACVQEGCQISPTEAHHIVDKGYREHSGGHQATIPLCEWHHRGEPRLGWNATLMAEKFGPSMARSKRAFVLRYGTERELLAKVNDAIGSLA